MGRVVVLGATGSIGRELCQQLVAGGRPVLLVGRDEARLALLAKQLDQPYARVDFSTSASLEQALQSRESELGGYDGLANCIGSILLKPAHLTSDQEFRETLETNLFTSFAAIRAAAKVLRSRGGAVVLFASAAAEVGIANHEAIAAAKAGIIGLARSAAATYAPNAIRVNVVSPGLVRTELTRRIWSNPASEMASLRMHALGRLGEASEVAALTCWLLSPQTSWITGQVIGIDGGLGHVLPRK